MVERQLVELDVAGVDKASGRRAHKHGEGIRDGMRDRDELKVERADLGLVAAFHDVQDRVDVVLVALCLDERQRELGTVQRDVRAQLEQVGHAADMIFVAVREHHAVDLVETVLDV